MQARLLRLFHLFWLCLTLIRAPVAMVSVPVALGVLLMGCAAEDTPVRTPTPDKPWPESTEARAHDCLDAQADKLAEGTYPVRFNLWATSDGQVQRVDAGTGAFDQRTHDLQICFRQALEAMPLPAFVLQQAAASGYQVPVHLEPLSVRAGSVGATVYLDIVVAPPTVERIAILSEVHAELSTIVEQTCKTAALEGTDRKFVGQHSGTTTIVLGRSNPQFEARVRELLGIEKIPEPPPSDYAPKPVPWDSIEESAVDFGRGMVSEVPIAFVPGGSIGADVAIEKKLLPQGTRAARIGRSVTDLIIGVSEIVVGCGGTIGGISMSATGGGAIAGVPVTVGSLTLVVTGMGNVAAATRRLTIEILRKDDGPESSSGPPPQTSQPTAKPPQQAPTAQAPQPAAKPPQEAPTQTTTTTTTRTKPPPKTTTPAVKGKPAADDYRGRYNTARDAQGKSRLPKDWEAHHRIPQVYRKHPEFKGFDFHAPSNIQGVKGPKADVNVHAKITTLWTNFQKTNPNATRKQIEDFARSIDVKFQNDWWK